MSPSEQPVYYWQKGQSFRLEGAEVRKFLGTKESRRNLKRAAVHLTLDRLKNWNGQGKFYLGVERSELTSEREILAIARLCYYCYVTLVELGMPREQIEIDWSLPWQTKHSPKEFIGQVLATIPEQEIMQLRGKCKASTVTLGK